METHFDELLRAVESLTEISPETQEPRAEPDPHETNARLTYLEELMRDLGEQFERQTASIQALVQWTEDGLLQDLKMTKDNRVSVAIDFENYLMSLASQDLEVTDYAALVDYLSNPPVFPGRERQWDVKSRVVFSSGRTRWKDYNRKLGITGDQARQHLDALRDHGFREVQAMYNVDVQLAFETYELVQAQSVNRLVLVANDGTYGYLVKQLADIGVAVSGVGIGSKMSKQLRDVYKDCGFKLLKLSTDLDFVKVVERGPAGDGDVSGELSAELSLDVEATQPAKQPGRRKRRRRRKCSKPTAVDVNQE